MLNHGLVDIVKNEIEESLNLVKFDNPIKNFFKIMRIAFFITLPFPNKRRFEERINDSLRMREIEDAYRKMRAIVSQLGNEPEVNKIYKCVTEILSLFTLFLDFLKNR